MYAVCILTFEKDLFIAFQDLRQNYTYPKIDLTSFSNAEDLHVLLYFVMYPNFWLLIFQDAIILHLATFYAISQSIAYLLTLISDTLVCKKKDTRCKKMTPLELKKN